MRKLMEKANEKMVEVMNERAVRRAKEQEEAKKYVQLNLNVSGFGILIGAIVLLALIAAKGDITSVFSEFVSTFKTWFGGKRDDVLTMADTVKMFV